MKLLKKASPIFLLFLLVFLFSLPILFGKIPVPADTILGMYHPWRDRTWDGYQRVPFKNFLITDPVRQQIPWKELAVSMWKRGKIPLWNPYTFCGTPLLANFQSGVFYPLNLLFFIFPFKHAWTIFIFLQQILGGVFFYLFLRHLDLGGFAPLFGSLTWIFSGFFLSWWEWGNILHTALWLPLILLAGDKILSFSAPPKRLIWGLIFLLSLIFSFFAGHLQIFFYVFSVMLLYLGIRLFCLKDKRREAIFLFVLLFCLFFLSTSIQWLSTFQFILLSPRISGNYPQKEGWFLPPQHLVQFLAPDFFGNPVTLNYWGKWNYAEFVGYIGIIPLIFALLAIFWRRDRKTFFFSVLVFSGLVFSLPTPLARLPYSLKIPFLSTSQPTRLIFIVDFALAVLTALGLDWLLSFIAKDQFIPRELVGKVAVVVLILGLVFGGLWVFVFFASQLWPRADWLVNLPVARRNLVLPSLLFLAFCIIFFLFIFSFLKLKRRKQTCLLFLVFLLFLSAFDLLRFARKFTPFVSSSWLFPSTRTVEFLQKDRTLFRFMTTDRRIFPPNFSVFYRLQTVEGYDPLFLQRYGELISAWERGRADISLLPFNRILRPGNFQSKIADLLNVKYVLSLTDLKSEKLELVFREGETRVYRNKNVLPRAFMVSSWYLAKNKEEAMAFLFSGKIDFSQTVVLESLPAQINLVAGKHRVKIKEYKENRVMIEVETSSGGILVLSDSYYPGWGARIDGRESEIFCVNYNFRGVFVPRGKHEVVFEYGGY